MNNIKSISIWLFILIFCFVLAIKLIDRTHPLELTTVQFLELAKVNAVDPKVAGNAGAVTNTAFDVVVDRSGRIEGDVKIAAVQALYPDLITVRLDSKTVPAEQMIPFTTSYVPTQAEEILKAMREYGVQKYKGQEPGGFMVQLLLTILGPLVLLGLLWFLFLRQIQSSGNKAMSFGKSKAKMVAEGQIKVTFDDVAGVEEAKEELKEIVEFLKDPKKFSRLGGKIPKGVLLFGPPGTGKTLLARAVAGEAGVPFFSISGSDFVEMFVGVGASRVRDLFEQAKKNKPCLIFIDEIDAVGRHRFAGIGGGHDEREQTLNQLLVEMDGFQPNEGVILVAATNRPDVLDPALLRPGRFDRQITVDYPDIIGRERILKVHSKGVKLASATDLKSIARGTPGFSGADLANIINEAALLAARANKTSVEQYDLEEAKDRVMMGPERRSLRIIEEEKRKTAIHEAGHALAAYYTPGNDKVHKITVVPRGRSLGLTAVLPEEEKHNYTKSQLKARLVYGLGGLAAEEVVLGEFSTGVGNDLNRITSTARRMVCEVGMSERLGPRTFGDNNNNVFLGRDMGNHEKAYSEEMARIIDEEVKALVDEAHQRAVQIMTDHRDILDTLTQALMDRETITADEFEMIVNGQPLPPLFKKDAGDPPTATPSRTDKKEEEKKKAPRLGDILDGPRVSGA
ncbi:ATP-dependent zinc metalloprotease FtsH [Candidatus Sumerlaeota bacterium]|nr:ATP-dependent zinc metalloprotease FtsH [Candidatus Sumerlaeota bacterium]